MYRKLGHKLKGEHAFCAHSINLRLCVKVVVDYR